MTGRMTADPNANRKANMSYVSSYDRDAPAPEVGSRWIWEATKPHARCLVEVVEVIWNGEEWWVRLRDVDSLRAYWDGRRAYWNDLGRFWEACTPERTT